MMFKKISILAFCFLFLTLSRGNAQDTQSAKLQYSSYYPAPLVSFRTLRLFPQTYVVDTSFTPPPCIQPGTLMFSHEGEAIPQYTEGTANFIFCNHASPDSDETAPFLWSPIPGVWSAPWSHAFITDTTSPQLKRVSITPTLAADSEPIHPFKLSIGNSSGIFLHPPWPIGSGWLPMTLPAIGPGTRFIFHGSKAAALRIGGIPDIDVYTHLKEHQSGGIHILNFWDDSNIGNRSVAIGSASLVSSPNATAIGFLHVIHGSSENSILLGGHSGLIENSPHAVGAGKNVTLSHAPFSVRLNRGRIQGVIKDSSGEVLHRCATCDTTNTVTSIITRDADIKYSPYAFWGGNNDFSQPTGFGFGEITASPYATILHSTAIIRPAGATEDSTAASLSDYINSNAHDFIGTGSMHRIERTLEETASAHALISSVPPETPASVIVGGYNNQILSASNSTILGGDNNRIQSAAPFWSTAAFSSIGGGTNNFIPAAFCTIVGGQGNKAGSLKRDEDDSLVAMHATVGGGQNNYAFGRGSFIGGGYGNLIGSKQPFESIGNPNNNDGKYSVIFGGKNNTILADYAVIGTGEDNTIGENGHYSVIETGKNITVNGSHSWAFGRNIEVNANNVFIFGYKRDADRLLSGPITVNQDNTFIIYNYPQGNGVLEDSQTSPVQEMKVGIQTINPQYTLDVNGNICAHSIILSTPQVASANTQWGTISTTSPYAVKFKNDIAEIFPAIETVGPGDVVVIAPSDDNAVAIMQSTAPYDKRVVGIVSTAPALVFEGDRIVGHGEATAQTTRPPIALSGRVACKVSLENGPIKVGDLLTTSSTPGHAMKATDREQAFGTVIGKALESFYPDPNNEQQTGLITVFVGLQ